MQKTLFALLLWAVCCISALAQMMPQYPLYLETQADVDSFPLKYGPLQVLAGSLIVGSHFDSIYSDIHDLNALASIRRVRGAMVVYYNQPLLSLHGLEGLDTVDYRLAVVGNPLLNGLQGLKALRMVGEALVIERNGTLQNLSGLDSLHNVGDDIYIQNNGQLRNLQGLGAIRRGLYVYIRRNDQLESLTGMDSLHQAINIEVVENKRLKTLAGINGLETVTGDILIAGNDSLEHCFGFQGLHKAFRIIVAGNPRLLDFAGGFGSSDLLEVGRLSIEDNPRLRSLDGLQRITTLLLSANVERNNSLQSLYGLDIERMGPPYSSATDLYIRDNPALTDLALNHLRVIGQATEAYYSHVEIRRNRSLKILNGFAVLDSCHARLWIGENDSMALVDIPALRYGYDIGIYMDSIEESRVGPFVNLEYVAADLSVYGAKYVKGFASLRKVGGDLRIVVEKGYIKGFDQLQKVGHSLSIYGLPYLAVLDGFHVLKGTGASLGCSYVRDTMRAFEQVDTVGYIPNSSLGVALSNFFYNGCYFDSCYKNLTYISGTFMHGYDLTYPNYIGGILPTFPALQKIGYALRIYNHEQGPSSINIFPQLVHVGPNTYSSSSTAGVFIFNNGRLQSLDGLEHLTKIVGKVEIYANDSLTDCSALCEMLQHAVISGPVTMHDNPFPCSSKPEILTWCDTAYVSTGGPHEALDFALWPNPTTGGVSVQLPDGATLPSRVSLYDLDGRLLWQAEASGGSPEFVLPSLSAGIYIFLVESGGQHGWRRLVLLPK